VKNALTIKANWLEHGITEVLGCALPSLGHYIEIKWIALFHFKLIKGICAFLSSSSLGISLRCVRVISDQGRVSQDDPRADAAMRLTLLH
jgi:hypothetical protein